jgi:hypothetical protein
MNFLSPLPLASFARRPWLTLSRESFSAAVIVVAALAGTAGAVPGADGAVATLLAALVLHKVLWLCLGIAVWHLLRADAHELGARDLMLAAPALALAGTAAGVWPWIGLALALVPWLRGLPRGAARAGLLIALASATHELAIDILGELAGDALLDIDARIAGLLSPWLLPGLAVSGTALQAGAGHTLILVWGCSSLSNLGEALLLCWALTSLHPAASARGHSRRLACCLGLLAVMTIALNATRLTLMASSMEAYTYVHDEGGAVLFRMAILLLAAAMSGVSIHDANNRAARVS